MTNAVEMIGITKRFPGVVANRNVTFQVKRAEIHALVGENGAGKSTLMNILYGLQQPDDGVIKLHGQPVNMAGPQAAIKLGVGMVHQHFMLVPSLTVLENIILGKTPTRAGFIATQQAEQRIAALSKQYGLLVDLHTPVFALSVGQMQRVEILKALYRGADTLILDEPTAVLTPQESSDLFNILRGLTAQGRTVIFITHKLKEVLALAQTVTVMRGGAVTGVVETSQTDEHALARLMVGREVVLHIDKPPAHTGDEVLRVHQLAAFNDRGLPALRQLNFNVRRGEIVGIAGVEGNGQTELVEVLTGLRRASAGLIDYGGVDITHWSPRARREQGIAHIPEDRLRLGVSKECTIEENLILGTYYKAPLARGLLLNLGNIEQFAQGLIKRFSIFTPNSKVRAAALSGGNMQKVVLAREMEHAPELLIAAQPTRGVDVGAIEYIHRQLIQLRQSGHGILLVSAELEEVMTLADRILVMYEGEIVGEFAGNGVSENELGLYMAGAKRR